MRLNRYLNEQYRYSRFAQDEKKRSERLIKKKLNEVKSHIQTYQSTLTLPKLCMILSSIYHKDKVRFIDDGESYIDSFKYIRGSDFYKNGDIEIFLTENAPSHLLQLIDEDRFKDMNDKFYKELVWSLSHTKVHVKRISKLKNEFTFIGYNPIKRHITQYLNHYAYLSAQELLDDGFSPTRSLVHDLIGQLSYYKTFTGLVGKYKNDELPRPSSVGLLS